MAAPLSPGSLPSSFATVFLDKATHREAVMTAIRNDTAWLIIRKSEVRDSIHGAKVEAPLIFERINAVLQAMRVYGVDQAVIESIPGVTMREEANRTLRGYVYHVGITGGKNHWRLGFEVLDWDNRVLIVDQLDTHESFRFASSRRNSDEVKAILSSEAAAKEYEYINTERKYLKFPKIDFAKRFNIATTNFGAGTEVVKGH